MKRNAHQAMELLLESEFNQIIDEINTTLFLENLKEPLKTLKRKIDFVKTHIDWHDSTLYLTIL